MKVSLNIFERNAFHLCQKSYYDNLIITTEYSVLTIRPPSLRDIYWAMTYLHIYSKLGENFVRVSELNIEEQTHLILNQEVFEKDT